MLVLEHGKPMIFGKDRDKGIRLHGLHPEVVTIGENGVTEADLLVHDEQAEEPYLALMLSRMFWPDVPGPGRRPARRRRGRPTTSSIDGPDRGGRSPGAARATSPRRSSAARPGPSSRPGASARCCCPVCGFDNLTGRGRLRQLRRGPRRSRRPAAGDVVPRPAARRAPRRARRAAAADRRARTRRSTTAIAPDARRRGRLRARHRRRPAGRHLHRPRRGGEGRRQAARRVRTSATS